MNKQLLLSISKTKNLLFKSRKWIFLSFLCMLLFQHSLFAQDVPFCGTVGGGPNSIGVIQPPNGLNPNSFIPQGPFHLKVYIYVIRRSDGTGGQTDAAIENAKNRLADDFNPHNIFFVYPTKPRDIPVPDDEYDSSNLICAMFSNPDYQHCYYEENSCSSLKKYGNGQFVHSL